MPNAGTTAGMAHGNRKLVVLGIPWDVDTEGLKTYMSQYGHLDDVIVMKDRATGRSRGFGYATFSSPDDAEKVAAMEHSLNGRVLEVKIATPKEEMNKTPTKKITRIFVARIPPSVSDETFRRYFEKYGTITDAFMPKDSNATGHRGIGFITFESSEAVDKVMAEKHELAGSSVAVDRATPKESTKPAADRSDRSAPSSYSPYGIYTAAANYGAAAFRESTFGAPKSEPSPYGAYESRVLNFESHFGPAGLGSRYRTGGSWSPPPPAGLGGDYRVGSWSPPPPAALGSSYRGGSSWSPPPTSSFISGAGRFGGSSANLPIVYGSNKPSPPTSRRGVKVFVGRLPSEATAEHLRRYFNSFGDILDVYVPKDAKNSSAHRGFGFVTFADEGSAERVTRRRHEILGVEVAVEHAEPPSDTNGGGSYLGSLAPLASVSDVGGPLRRSNSNLGGPGYDLHGGLDVNRGWRAYGGLGPISGVDDALPIIHRPARVESRYRPY